MMISVDGERALRFAIEKSLGLPQYKFIIEQVFKTDVAHDEKFQKVFNGFYGVRRNSDWREHYYHVFEQMKKCGDVTFEDIFKKISTESLEASFASKMLATLNPQKPIWDSRVIHFLELPLPKETKEERTASIINTYKEIEKRYQEYLLTEGAKNNIALFDRRLPEYTWISATKKIDFMIWSYDASKNP